MKWAPRLLRRPIQQFFLALNCIFSAMFFLQRSRVAQLSSQDLKLGVSPWGMSASPSSGLGGQASGKAQRQFEHPFGLPRW